MAHGSSFKPEPGKGQRCTSRRRLLGALATLLVLFTFAQTAAAQSLWDNLLTGVELAIGDGVAANVVAEYGEPIRLPPASQRWVDTIFADIVAQGSRKDIPYRLYVLESDVVNAFAAPGGHIFITTGLLRHLGPDSDALANVLGHEVAHVEHRHGMNTLLRQLGIGFLLQLVLADAKESELFHTAVVLAGELVQLGFSREQEYESDELGQRLAAQAGYDPQGMVRFFDRLQELEGAEVPFLEFLRTHPLTSERAQRAQVRAASLTVAPRPGGPPVPPTEIVPPSSSGSRADTQKDASSASRQAYRDPAERFSLELPAGWEVRCTLYGATTRFDGPQGERLWISVVDRRPHDTDPVAFAERILARYPLVFQRFVLERRAADARLADLPAAYAEYRYTEASATVREGSYFLLHGDSGILFQFAASAPLFPEAHQTALAIADTLALGPGL